MNFSLNRKIYWIIPILFVFILAFIITTSSNWPISWDIYIHINYALTYLNHGFTTVDPLLNAPGGKEIGYMPLFHLLLIAVSYVTGSNLIETARIFQIVLPVICVAVVMYISYKFHDEKAALASGLLLISSFMFTRMYLPIPESVAIILFVVGIFLFRQSTVLDNNWYAFLSGILALVILATHFSSFIYYMILLTMLMIAQVVWQRSGKALKSYAYALVSVVLVALLALFVLLIIDPSYLNQIVTYTLSLVSDPFSIFSGQVAMGLERYIKCIGWLPLLFGIIGFYYSFRNREILFVSLWVIFVFILSNLHWFGIPVYTYRMLIYVVIPGVILGGYGFSKLYDKLVTRRRSYGIILLLLLIIFSFGCGYMAINDASVKTSSATTEISTYQIAPPTSDEQDVINWFATEDVQNKSMLINNQFFGTIISSADEVPMHYKFDTYINMSDKPTAIDSLNKDNIGYIVYDKDLVVNNTTDYDNLSVISVNGSFYPTYYFTKEVTDDNFDQIKLTGTKVVYENNRFIICKVNG